MLPNMEVNLGLILAVIASLGILYVISRLLYYPLRFIFKVLLQTTGGLLILFIFNSVASLWGVSLGVNLFTALLVGVMGIPALVMLLCLQLIL